MIRPNSDTYLMNMAKVAATRATCDRKHVGAVIARDGYILATGYNGSATGLAHCSENGCMMEDGHCVRTVHAEINAICQAAKHGNAINEATIYVTASPCWNCWLALVNVGITRIVYDEVYRANIDKYNGRCKKLGIELVHLTDNSVTTVQQAFADPIITAKEKPVEPTRNPENGTPGYIRTNNAGDLSVVWPFARKKSLVRKEPETEEERSNLGVMHGGGLAED